MLFFKYQKPGNLEFTMLRRGEVYFASTSELNDAHECKPQFILNGNLDLWQRLAEHLLQVACFKSGCLQQGSVNICELLKLANPVGRILKQQASTKDLAIGKLSNMFLDALVPLLQCLLSPQQIRDIAQWIRRYIDFDLPRRLLEDRYIASFSLTATNPTMWGHYAGAETGFVIVFTTSNKTIDILSPISILNGTRPSKNIKGAFEIGIYKDESLELMEVKYCTRRPKVNAFHQLISMFNYSEEEDHYDVPLLIAGNAPEKQESSVGLVKHSGWRYEKEIRAFFPTFDHLAPDVRAIHVSSRNMLGLIFGPRMSQLDVARAVVCCHLMRQSHGEEHPTDFMLFQAKQQVKSLNIEIKPVGILDGNYFGEKWSLPIKRISKLPLTKASDIREIAKTICT
jgi:hypothetical protein